MTSTCGLFLLVGAVAHVITNRWRAAFLGHEALPLPIVANAVDLPYALSLSIQQKLNC